MTRDDLYGYYRRYYVPNNATLVIVGDVDTDDALRRVEQHFGGIRAGPRRRARRTTVEPEQTGERRVTIRKEGTTAYLKVGVSRAGASTDPDFFPLLVLDAVLTGAKGLNLWSSFRMPPPQRSARLYRALVERGLASSVSRRRCCRPSSRFSTRCRRRPPKARRSQPSKPRCSRSSIAVRRDGITPAGAARRRRRSCARGWCSTATASRTSRTSSDTSKRSPSVDVLHRRSGARSRR